EEAVDTGGHSARACDDAGPRGDGLGGRHRQRQGWREGQPERGPRHSQGGRQHRQARQDRRVGGPGQIRPEERRHGRRRVCRRSARRQLRGHDPGRPRSKLWVRANPGRYHAGLRGGRRRRVPGPVGTLPGRRCLPVRQHERGDHAHPEVL
ncbi:MAG: hypothetical protein AVDCRST_MAG01-01-2762, partial [uncultured Rubrobacteraceae bacterium]